MPSGWNGSARRDVVGEPGGALVKGLVAEPVPGVGQCDETGAAVGGVGGAIDEAQGAEPVDDAGDRRGLEVLESGEVFGGERAVAAHASEDGQGPGRQAAGSGAFVAQATRQLGDGGAEAGDVVGVHVVTPLRRVRWRGAFPRSSNGAVYVVSYRK